MKATFAAASVLMFALIQSSASPAATDQGSPSTTNVPGAEFPSVHADRSITFKLKAPEANSVAVAGGDGLGSGPFRMTKGADGVWEVTTPPAVPGFHYYWFVLNGVQVNDPASQTYFGYGHETSGVEVPEAGADFYLIKDVPHGEVREKSYFASSTLNLRTPRTSGRPGAAGSTILPRVYFADPGLHRMRD